MHWLFSHLLCYSCCTTAAWFTRWWGRNDTLRKQGRVISSSRTWMTMHEQGQVNFTLGCSSPLSREISIYHHSTSFTKLFLDHGTAFPNFLADPRKWLKLTLSEVCPEPPWTPSKSLTSSKGYGIVPLKHILNRSCLLYSLYDFWGKTLLLNFTPYTLYYNLQSELARLKNAKNWISFHFQFKTFGNMHHPNVRIKVFIYLLEKTDS